MDHRFATKTNYEREQEEAERLVRDNPKVKPPRHDSRRERTQERDPDTSGDPDLKGDKDLSLNFKSVGGSVSSRVLQRFVRATDAKMVTVVRKEDGRVVNVSEDTLREEPGKYELPEKEEDTKRPEAPAEDKDGGSKGPETQPSPGTSETPEQTPPSEPESDEVSSESSESATPESEPATSGGAPANGPSDVRPEIVEKARGFLKKLKGKDKKKLQRAVDMLTDPKHAFANVAGDLEMNDEWKGMFDATTYGEAREIANSLKSVKAWDKENEGTKSPPSSKPPSSKKPSSKGPSTTPPSAPKPKDDKAIAKKVLERYRTHKKEFGEFAQKLPTTRGEGASLKFNDPKTKKMVPFEALPPKEQARLMERFDQEERGHLHGGALFHHLTTDLVKDLTDTFSSDESTSDLAKQILTLRKKEKVDEEALQIEKLLPKLKGKLPKGMHTIADLRRAVQARPDLFKAEAPEAKGAPEEGKDAPAPAPEEGKGTPTEQSKGEKPKGDKPKEEKPKKPKGDKPRGGFPGRREFDPKEPGRVTATLLDQLPQADRTPDVIRALGRFTSLHPDDIPDAFATFMALKNDPSTPSLDDIVAHGSKFYQTDPSEVPPPEKWKDSDGVEKPFAQLSPEVQSVALNKHQARTVALSLATATRLGKALTRDGAPPDLSQALAKNLLSGSHDPEEARREAGKLFDHLVSQQSPERVSPSDAKHMLSKLLKHPSARRVAVGYLQGLDYLDALDQLFDENNISERSYPLEISRALIDVSQNLADKDERIYGSDSVMNVGAAVRSRVLSYLDTLAPEKGAKVREEIADYEREEEERRRERMAPPDVPYRTPASKNEAPQHRETPAEEQLRLLGIPAGKLAYTYSSYHTGGSMGRPYTQRHALYHGVDPYSKEKGPAVYADWSQAHARDLGDADFKTILKSARAWLRAPVLAKNVEGVVRDTQLRAALDLAIRTCEDGRYAGAIAPTVYDDLLRQLAGVGDKGTLLTVREANTPVSASSPYGAGEIETTAMTRNAVSNSTNKGNTMKGSVELRSYATRIASTHPEIAYDLVELSARLAADEQQEGGQQQEQAQGGQQQAQDQGQQQEQSGQQQGQAQGDGQQKQAAAYRALRASLVQAVAQNPKLRAPLLPVLQILKQVG